MSENKIHDLIDRYAHVNCISYEEAEQQIGAITEEEILAKIKQKSIEKINATRAPANREQRRALRKKLGAKKYAEMLAENGDIVRSVSETARKLNYIDLIQRLQKINNEEKNEDGETTTENN